MQHPAAFPLLLLPEQEQPEDATLAEFPQEERILVVVAQQPWSSVSDIAKRLTVSNSDIHKACHALEESKLIAGREIGVTRRSQRRYVLARQSVMHVTKNFQNKGLLRAALPLTWQMTEEGVSKMLLWAPMFESLYEILPTFWTSGLAAPFQLESKYSDPACTNSVWLGVPTLVDVLWLPRGRLHAVAIWRFDRFGRRPRFYSIPFLWAGLLPQEDYKSRSLRLGSSYVRCAWNPNSYISWDIEPRVAAIGMDQFAAFRAGTAYGDDVLVGSVDTSGALVWSAEASHSEWTLGDQPPQARSIGHPEAAAIEGGPDLVNLGGIREYRVFAFLSEFRAATKADLVTAFRMSRGAANTVIDHLTERELVTSVGTHLYLTRKGVEMLAALHRVDADRLVEVTYLDPEGDDALRERRHDSVVATLAAKFVRAGIPVAAGWRWVVSWRDGQLVPDLWVQLPVPGRDEGIWVPVEVEFSAKTEKRIRTRKLRSYHLGLIRLKEKFTPLVITGDALAAERFDKLAGNLPMITTTSKEFLTGVWEGPESVWRRGGRPVGLSDFAREHRPGLWQRTGRSLDCSKPSPEVWGRLFRLESIWSDPMTEGLDLELPPVDPQLHADMDLVPNEAKAVPSDNKAFSAPPPPPPVAVIRKPTVEDRDRDRSRKLRGIHWLVARVDETAESILKDGELSNAERLCLRRVRAIITYGARHHYQAEHRQLEVSLKNCIILRDEHLQVLRTEHRLWWLTVPENKTDPRQAFRKLLRNHPSRHGVKDACKKFDNWFETVDRAARAAR